MLHPSSHLDLDLQRQLILLWKKPLLKPVYIALAISQNGWPMSDQFTDGSTPPFTADRFTSTSSSSSTSRYFFNQDALAVPVNDVFSPASHDSFSFTMPSPSTTLYPPYPHIYVEDADCSQHLSGDMFLAGGSGMYDSSAGWPAMEDFPYIPAGIMPDQVAPNPSYTNATEPFIGTLLHAPVLLEPVLHDGHEDQGAKGSGSKNSHAKRKSLMQNYQSFCDENKIIKIFSKAARDRVSTLNGLRASKIRRKNPPKFFCDLCPADFTRKHNLDSGLS